MVSAEEVVLSSDGNRTDCIFHTVVVDVVSTVKDIAAQSRKECVCIDQGLPHPGFRGEGSGHGVHPVLELLDYLVGLLMTAFLDCIIIKTGFLHLLFDAVQLADIYKGFACALLVLIEGFNELAPLIKSF